MRYVHEFVDEMACMRCPHNAPATEENGWEGFDFVCYAREDGDEFLFPEECPTYFGPWGAWRAFADHHMAMVFLTYWCARVNGWKWNEMQLYRILRDAVPQLAEPVGWSP